MGVTSSDGTESAAGSRPRRAAVAAWVRQVPRAMVPLLQVTVAATVAWVIALQFGGHSEPFFAPMSVVVALSSPLGERGSNAVRLVAGVMIGIVVGELTVLVLGGGFGRIALATFSGMALARLLGGPRLVMVQAAAGAILTVAAADGEAGLHRLIDAAIGAAVVLVFSQVLLSPEPVRLVRRAAADALSRMAAAVHLIAAALAERDAERSDAAITALRTGRDGLAELARVQKASGRVARHSAIWRSRIEPVVRENENVGHLDLLDASCLVLARAVAAEAIVDAEPGECDPIATCIDRLARALTAMAGDLGDRAMRQAAADEALAVARDLDGIDARRTDHPVAPLLVAVRLVALDVMIVAGVPPAEAEDAVRQGTGELEVPHPPGTPRMPFATPARLQRRRRRRRRGRSPG